MEQEVLVKVEGLSKKFCKSLKKSLRYGVQDLMGSLMGKQPSDKLRKDEFWALKDINFELRRGECLGLIGHNGAGKSTLLKILNGLINPDHGKVTMRGRVGALIELGAGFNPILSGRENIYNNGAVLGFSKAEIDDKVEAIIDFAEIRDFIDMPVQNYSSGMKVRLGFAVAAQMEPDVLIIDEVLAVGDMGFVLKCFKQIDQLLPKTALIFVSHNMPMISRICTHAILLSKGKVVFQGNQPSKGIDNYYSMFTSPGSTVVYTDKSISFNKLKFLSCDESDSIIPKFYWGEDLIFEVNFNVLRKIKVPIFTFHLLDKEQRPIASFQRDNQNKINRQDNIIDFKVTHKNLQLSKGIYSINIAIRDRQSKEPIYRENGIASFQVIHKEDTWAPFLLKANYH